MPVTNADRPLGILGRTLRARTICRIAKLTLNLFVQNFPLPCRAITFDNVAGAKIGMRFRSVITDTDGYIFVKRTNRCRTGSLQRVSNSRSEIVGAAIDGHKEPPLELEIA
jgi:hypothetical protein